MDATRALVRDVVLKAVRTIRHESEQARPNPGMLSVLYERAQAAYELLPDEDRKTLWLAGIERVR